MQLIPFQRVFKAPIPDWDTKDAYLVLRDGRAKFGGRRHLGSVDIPDITRTRQHCGMYIY